MVTIMTIVVMKMSVDAVSPDDGDDDDEDDDDGVIHGDRSDDVVCVEDALELSGQVLFTGSVACHMVYVAAAIPSGMWPGCTADVAQNYPNP